jgi:hypothetical protein
MGIIRKVIYIIIFFLLTGAFFVQKANAASLTSVSDLLSTSRPSAAAPLSAVNGVAASIGEAQIFDNGSFFLASDSAVILRDPLSTLELSDVGLKIASMSATGVPSGNNRIVYFSNSTVNAHHQGVALVTPITATHTIKFTTISTIPTGGSIIINFPGAGSNAASPSATGFAFNGELAVPTDVICFPVGACSGGKASNQSNSFTLTTSGGAIAGGTTIYINIGCTAAAAGPCTAFASRLINPTKTAVAGTADAWKISIQTTDTPANGSVVLDSAILRAATIESVQVQATVEPTITFTIAGITDNTTFNSVNSNCALNGGNDKTNTGITATATSVNLGLLNSGTINAAGQTLTVTTNGSSGYAITATTSGHLINPASGNYFSDANGPAGSNPLTANDAPAANGIVAGSTDFGISPCGAHVTSPAYGGTGGIVFNGASLSTALFTNPWDTGTNGFFATIASYSGGPVSNDVTVIRYAAAISTTQPSGIYSNVVSYVATATF